MTLTPVRPVTAGPDQVRDALLAELAEVRAALRAEVPHPRPVHDGPASRLAARLGLSAFERSVLLLVAGPELVAEVAGELLQRTGAPALSFGAALALLPDAHWSAVAPTGGLRRWRLVELDDPRSPTGSPLLVDEAVLHHLVGLDGVDPQLAALSRPVVASAEPPPVWQDAAAALSLAWAAGTAVVRAARPADGRAVTTAAAHLDGAELHELRGESLPREPAALAELVVRAEREVHLADRRWLVDVSAVDEPTALAVTAACLRASAGIAVLRASGAAPQEPGSRTVEVPALDLPARTRLLGRALERAGAPQAGAAAAAGVFDLTAEQAVDVAGDVAAGEPLWAACRRRSPVASGRAARHLVPRAGWDDLVLPDAQLRQLQALVSAVRHRGTVLADWGFGDRTARGLGTTALFTGASGTGKTLAAEVVAGELGLDVLQVDLSQVLSKYVGETEKHLGEVFDAAERGAAVLLFDEADALFGKRSEVRDSHDRYANTEVGYLLQRTERFRGLAVLTTNARGALDQAFLRRLQAVVVFPYPDVGARERLWARAFPDRTPTAGIDARALAAVDVPGGTIAAAALTAAYLAAERTGAVTPDDVREALAWELAKTGRTVTGR